MSSRRPKRQGAEPDGPHGRLGVVWAAATTVVLLLGTLPLAVWMAVHAGLAAMQAARTYRRSSRHPAVPHALTAAGAAAVVPLGCTLGFSGALAALVLAVAAGITVPVVLSDKQTDALRTVGLAVTLGAAAGSLVLARGLGSVPGLFLFLLMCAHDTGAYLIGTGANNAWEGPAAGIAAMGPVTLGAAALAVPPFTETGPWILGGIAAVLMPAGPWVASRLLKSHKTRVPAVRRIDALILAGPVWAVAALLLRA